MDNLSRLNKILNKIAKNLNILEIIFYQDITEK